MFDRWIRTLRSPGQEDPPAAGAAQIVLSMPPAFRQELSGAAPLEPTYDAFAGLFSGARRHLKLFVPYVDPSFTALVALARVPVQVLTTMPDGRGSRASPVLERCALVHDVTVRYLNERRDKALLYQVHAKMILADGERAYVGSANLTDTSIHYNLELGLRVADPDLVRNLEKLFDTMYDRLGVPSRRL